MHHVNDGLLLVFQAQCAVRLVVVLHVERGIRSRVVEVAQAEEAAAALGLGGWCLLHVRVLVGPFAIDGGVVHGGIQRTQVEVAYPQYLAAHLTHSDIRAPVVDEQSLVLLLLEYLLEQHRPVALVFKTVVSLQLGDEELRGVGLQVVLHLVDGLFECNADLADAVGQTQDFLLLRVLGQRVDAHHGAQVEEPHAAGHLFLKGR